MTILKVINLKLIKDDKKFKLHITQIVKCGESELPSSIKHANMPIFILVNYLFLHSCLLENLAFSPEIVWLCEMISKSLCTCKSVHYIDINYNSAHSEAQKEKVKRI